MDIKKLTAASLALAAFASTAALGGEVEWIGGSDDSFGNGANWNAGVPPSATDAFLLEDEDNNGVVVLDNDYEVGGLYSRNPVAGRTDNYSHTIDLNGHRLTVSGPLHMQQYWNVPDAGRDSNHGDNYLVISNGYFQLGSDGALSEIIFGRSWDNYYYSHLTFGTNTIFDAHIGEMWLGRGTGGWAQFDLRNVDEIRVGNEIGVFRAEQVILGYEGNGAHFRDGIELLFGPALKSFEVKDNLQIAYWEQNKSWIGQADGNGTAPMPAGADVRIGVDSTRRAKISIGQSGYWPTYGHFAGPVGGDCTAWISDITIGVKATGGNGTSWGSLDLRNMDSIAMDVSGAVIVGSSADSVHQGTGRIALPPGTASFSGDVTLGSDYGFGELLLNGTAATITKSLTANPTGLVSNNVMGASCGLDIAAGASFSFNGKMVIVFAQPDASAGEDGPYWGFRIVGDHSVELAQLMTQGKIVVDDTQIPGTANIYYDADADYTYIAHRANGQWAPTVVTQPLLVEVDPDVSTSFVIDRADIDLSPAQEGMEINFTGPTDQTPDSPSIVTLPPITLSANDEPLVISNSLTYSSQAAGTTTVASELTVTPLLPRSTSALTWTGGASLTHHYRPDWRWSANWSPETGGPAEETLAKLVFNDTSLATNRIDCDRLVGGIDIQNSAGTHVFDLGEHTLAVTNPAYTATSTATAWNSGMKNAYHERLTNDGAFSIGGKDTVSSALAYNGTLALRKGGLFIDSNGSGWGSLVISNAVLDADCDIIRIPTTETGALGKGILDITDATVKDGTMKAEAMLVGYGMLETQNFSEGRLAVSDDTGLTNVVASQVFAVAFGHRIGNARFGDPENDWKLPANVSFNLGESADSRAEVYIGYSNWGGDIALLEATSGGVFNGWVSTLHVGRGMRAYLRLAAMESINLDANALQFTWDGNKANDHGGADAEVTLPPGHVRTDALRMAQIANARVTLNGTTVEIDDEATIGVGAPTATVTTILNGTSAGLCFGEDVIPSFGDNARIAILFNAAPTAIPYSGVTFKGNRIDEVQALLDSGKITVSATDGVDISRVRVFYYHQATHVGIPPDGGTVLFVR